MHLSEIENLLYKTMGLNTESIGSSAVMSAVNYRMTACEITDLGSYTEKVKSDKNELQELIEEVVVAETWFFRDQQPFKMLTRYITEEWLPSNPKNTIRILSLPCASGEEPYSIAITLIEAGLMPSQLKIDAFDISERNIERCKIARYRENSFRGVDSCIRDRFFNYENNNYYPDILIKAMVNFEKASVLDPVFASTQIPYDIVFCRNLLIYFDRDTQSVAEKMLHKLLKPGGMLFVGHAETSIFSQNWYISKLYPKSFIVRKFDDGKKQSEIKKSKHFSIDTRKSSLDTGSVIKNKLNYTKKRNSINRRVNSPVIDTPILKEVTSIKKVKSDLSGNELIIARQLADSGKLNEAEAICISYLESNKQDIEVYFLLAFINLGIGDEQKSTQYFKNVIYLDPNHYDALMYLSTILGNEGNETGATRFRDRAQRIKVRNELELDNA